ncbi:MAG: site-specific DNA-methyltransferase [Euryarchaeota archaeon]|nr:site-specific DNA-methyltransferase [Euryarchaeota archaeon]
MNLRPWSACFADEIDINGYSIHRYIGDFWTSRQRQEKNIHEVPYRACFKPQLPAFFINALTSPSEIVYDPFAGRGTTPITAGLMNRHIIANDINPLSEVFIRPRLSPPEQSDVLARLSEIPYDLSLRAEFDLSMFYDPQTEAEICSLRSYFMQRKGSGEFDSLDAWIRMVATTRLSGHSSGFFSVYTLPPNQAVLPLRQIIINKKREQVPPYRNTKELIAKKSKQLLSGLSKQEREILYQVEEKAQILCADARNTYQILPACVDLTVTSPPFLDVVAYNTDNWLRCWFCGIDAEAVGKQITVPSDLGRWSSIMSDVFLELFRITRPGGFVAFEVGEVRGGEIRLDEVVVPLGIAAGFVCEGIVIHTQTFTKTAHIWGVSNMIGGTNTNRIVVFQKPVP